jgi:phosphatidylglycerophosphatase A
LRLTQRLALVIATCGYVGYAPIAPGTAGSAVALVLLGVVRSTASAIVEIAVLAVLAVAGIWSAGVAERHVGRTDPGMVVIDEVVGMLITLLLVPVDLIGACFGFFVFRLLDIMKPWPARRLEKLPGGVGIMADDAMAGLYGYLIVRGLIEFAPAWLT